MRHLLLSGIADLDSCSVRGDCGNVGTELGFEMFVFEVAALVEGAQERFIDPEYSLPTADDLAHIL
ncbi:MAG TPA: hypothetical protein DDY20_13600 [Desulfobulbaceae bacterium]|nr:hypothetical protein [Desulfobulbaceae bacterium]